MFFYAGKEISMNSEQRIANVQNALEILKNSQLFQDSDFIENVSYFVEDFKNHKTEAMKTWLEVYDAQSQFVGAYPVPLMSVVLHPNYLPVYHKQYTNEFEIIKSFVEYVRKSIIG